MEKETLAVDGLPQYAPGLKAYHRAFRRELRTMVQQLPLIPGGRVLDVACGDAAYSGWFRELGRAAAVVAVDISRSWLEEAARNGNGCLALCQTSAEQLPFGDNQFELVWCAQSLYSLPDFAAALREMVRVTRRGGSVAILENDSLHQVVLPWPVELELAIRAAEHDALVRESDCPEKFYIGRQITRTLTEAGLVAVSKAAWATNRQAPLTQDERTFLVEYLRSLRQRVEPYLARRARKALWELSDPEREGSMLQDPTLSMTCLDFVVRGTKP